MNNNLAINVFYAVVFIFLVEMFINLYYGIGDYFERRRIRGITQQGNLQIQQGNLLRRRWLASQPRRRIGG